MNGKHTAAPWKFGNKFTSRGGEMHILETADGKKVIAHVSIPMPNPNADRIIECVNAHDALTARVAELETALQELCGQISRWPNTTPPDQVWCARILPLAELARAALAGKVTP